MESATSNHHSNGTTNGGPLGGERTKKTAKLDTTSPPDRDETGDESSTAASPITSPPYWVQSHTRSFSNISVESMGAGAITLQDNTDEQDAKNKACWARSVYIEDHVVINGSRTGIGAFVVWNITVETLHVKISPTCFT